jgi:predicted outer membrane lipoprotein
MLRSYVYVMTGLIQIIAYGSMFATTADEYIYPQTPSHLMQQACDAYGNLSYNELMHAHNRVGQDSIRRMMAALGPDLTPREHPRSLQSFHIFVEDCDFDETDYVPAYVEKMGFVNIPGMPISVRPGDDLTRFQSLIAMHGRLNDVLTNRLTNNCKILLAKLFKLINVNPPLTKTFLLECFVPSTYAYLHEDTNALPENSCADGVTERLILGLGSPDLYGILPPAAQKEIDFLKRKIYFLENSGFNGVAQRFLDYCNNFERVKNETTVREKINSLVEEVFAGLCLIITNGDQARNIEFTRSAQYPANFRALRTTSVAERIRDRVPAPYEAYDAILNAPALITFEQAFKNYVAVFFAPDMAVIDFGDIIEKLNEQYNEGHREGELIRTYKQNRRDEEAIRAYHEWIAAIEEDKRQARLREENEYKAWLRGMDIASRTAIINAIEDPQRRDSLRLEFRAQDEREQRQARLREENEYKAWLRGMDIASRTAMINAIEDPQRRVSLRLEFRRHDEVEQRRLASEQQRIASEIAAIQREEIRRRNDHARWLANMNTVARNSEIDKMTNNPLRDYFRWIFDLSDEEARANLGFYLYINRL